MVAGIVLAAASAATAEAPAGRSARTLPAWLDTPLGEVLSPGTLASAHGHLEGASACLQCHDPFQATPDEKCLACHAEIAKRAAARSGFHGRATGRCATCHTEHRGPDADLLGLDRDAFNHDRAVFALRGAHREVRCEKCHLRTLPDAEVERFHPLGILHATCGECHEDVHGEAFLARRDCGDCHTEASWESDALRRAAISSPGERSFAHGRDTDFALEGAHRRVACRECHTVALRELEHAGSGPPGTAASRDCAGCHDDPHRAALSARCQRCHSPATWEGGESPFDHTEHTRFALDAVHAPLSCDRCHADSRFQASATECAGCHPEAGDLLAGRFAEARALPDPHQRLGCAECHDSARESARLLDYERECVRCHTPEYGSLLLTRRRFLDELIVRAEGRIRARELAVERGELPVAGGPLDPLRRRVEQLARSGLHHPELAEALLHDVLRRLEGSRAAMP